MEGGGTEEFLIFVGLEFGGHFFLFRKFGRAVFVNKIKFFFISMDSISDFFYKRTSVFGRFDRRLLLCLCFISVFVRVAI